MISRIQRIEKWLKGNRIFAYKTEVDEKINDNSAESVESTYSASKIEELIAAIPSGGEFSGTMDDIDDGATYVKTENNYTDAEQTKLSGIATGAEVNVNADWNGSGDDSEILNKPTIPTISDTAYDATTWDANTDGATKNAIRDQIETMIDRSYFPSAITVNAGDLDTGAYTDLAAIGGTDVNISEASGADPLQIDIDFVSVERLDNVVIYGRYIGGAGHHIDVSVYNVVTTNYDIIGSFGSTTGNQWYAFNIFNSSAYLDSGAVQIRLNHPDNGVITHDLILDYVELRHGGGGGGSTTLNASGVVFIPAGGLSSENVQEALEELDADAHTQGTDTALGALSTKNPPIDADKAIYRDSTASDALVTSTWTQIKAFLKTYFDTQYVTLQSVYPVGSIYTETTGVNPATTFGFGTWTAFGAGKVLIGLDGGDGDFDTAEETGGAKTKAISAHAGTAVADHASHTHGTTQNGTSTKISYFALDPKTGGMGVGITGNPLAVLTHSVTQPSAHSDLNVVQPYIVVHFWKRTA